MLDILVLAGLGLAVLRGYRRGVLRAVASLVVLVVAIVVAYRAGPIGQGVAESWTGASPLTSRFIASAVVFLVVFVGARLLISQLLALSGPARLLDQIGGALVSMAAFVVVAGLLVLPALSLGGSEPFAGLGWDPHGGDGGGLALEIVAGVAAVVVMTYAGAVLARPRAIPYWNSPAVPLQFLLSSAAMSVAVVMLIEVIAGEPVTAGQMVLLAVLTAALLVATVAHLLTRTAEPGKRESLDRLLRGQYRGLFAGFVVAAGTALPLVLAVVGAAASGARDALAVLCFLLLVPGGFWLRLLTLRVGIFPPVHIPGVGGPRSVATPAGG